MNRKNRIISLILAVIMILSCSLLSLTSCKKDKGDDKGKKPGGGIVSGDVTKTQDFTITVRTQGGMLMSGLPVYIFEYEDGSIGDLVEGVYASTDENGKASFTLPGGKSYAARVNFPDGYDAKPYYPLVKDTQITVSSTLLPDEGLDGISYNLGDIMHDFTVTNTNNEKVTLSELLKEKDAVLLNFWYVGCSWCGVEFPYMQSAYEKYSDDIAIIALNPSDLGDSISSIVDYQQMKGLTFDVAQDKDGIYSAFSVLNYPTSVMIDRYGVITLVEVGAIPSERAFEYLFDYVTGDDYVQRLITNVNDIVPQQKPDVEMPDAGVFGDAFEKEDLGNINYRNEEDDEFSWPFITDKYDGHDVVRPSNKNIESSYAQLVFDIELNAGDVLAFDYLSSTEKGVDILYVVVDGKNLFEISGESEEWSTCYAYVAEETGTYEVGLVYLKDSGDDIGDDTVYLKDLRIVTENEVDEPTYIYRFAATNPDEFSNYQTFAPIFFNENDGYWHVDSKDGPILLANLMGYTRFSENDYVYNMSLGKDYEADLVKYCSYASNSSIGGICSVTEELRQLLIRVAKDYGSGVENEWLEFCCYFDAYGTDEQLTDPIKGLAPFAAFDTILSAPNADPNDYPNEIVYDRGIMPRGLLSKFTPTQSGTYLIASYAPGSKVGEVYDCEGWIFTEEGFANKEVWYTYENVDKINVSIADGDTSNCYMMVYLEAGKDYYINIAYADVAMIGTIYFRIQRLGGEGVYRLALASPGPFTAHESIVGELTQTIIKGIPVKLDANGYYREDRADGKLGSLIYADFTGLTTIFGNSVIYSDKEDVIDMIEARAFDFRYSEEDLYVLNYLDLVGGDVEKCKADLKAELGEAYNNEYYDYNYDGTVLPITGYAVEEVLAGVYHGSGKDETETIRKYVDKIIKPGDVVTILNENGTGTTQVVVQQGSAMVGCVAVDEELATILQQLMDKYVFEGVENSWLKLCYYEQYFCEATPH